MNTIPVWVNVLEEDEHEQTKGIRGLFSSSSEAILKEIPTTKIKDNLSNLCEEVSTLFTDIRKVGDFKLKEITIQVEINAEGGIEMIGTAKIGGKGAITLVFSE